MELTVTEIFPGEIFVNPKKIARIMGIDEENIPEHYEGIIREEIHKSAHYLHIKGGYRLCREVDFNTKDHVLVIEGVPFNVGKLVITNLKKSEILALFICTAGEEVSLRSNQLMTAGSLVEGYVADLIGSVVIDEAMNILRQQIMTELEDQGLKITNHFSPGYCDWNVNEQHKLFCFFSADFCGVQLSKSAMMHPVKSISGVMGIGKDVRFNKNICNACPIDDCTFRNAKYMPTC